MKIEYTTDIKGGNFSQEIREKLADDLRHLEGKSVTLTIEPITINRSDKQNRYYFGCVIEAEKQCFKERYGEIFTKNEIHEFNKSKFFQREIYDAYINEVMVFPGSSKRFSTVEFEEKLEMIRRYFEVKFNWYIPAPNEKKLIFSSDEVQHSGTNRESGVNSL